MGRRCTVCYHPKRPEIERGLVVGKMDGSLAKEHGLSRQALRRHREEHLAGLIAKAKRRRSRAAAARVAALDERVLAREAAETAAGEEVVIQTRRCLKQVELLLDACDRWLRDPEAPERYELGPRAEELVVTYLEASEGGKRVRRKGKLSELPEKVVSVGQPVRVEPRHADPRQLLLRAATRLEAQLELMGRVVVEPEAPREENVLASPGWIRVRTAMLEALEGFPEARAAVAARLAADLGVVGTADGTG